MAEKSTDLLTEATGTRHRLWANGFRPVEVYDAVVGDKTTGKRPYGNGWQLEARADPPGMLQRSARPGFANTGILADALRPLDLDIDTPKVAAAVEALAVRMLGSTIRRYREHSCRVLLLYRAEVRDPGEIRKKSRIGPNGKVEALGFGNQFVAFGQHWEHGADLQWAPLGPDEIVADHLPMITEEALELFLDAAQALLGPAPAKANGADPPPPGPATPRQDSTSSRYDGLRRSLMADIAALADGDKHDGLVRLGRTFGGHQAAAGWADDDLTTEAMQQLAGRKVENWINARQAFRDGLAYGRGEPLPLEDRPNPHQGKTNGASPPDDRWAPGLDPQPETDKPVLRLHIGGENMVGEPLQTVVEGLLHRGSITLAYGPPKSGKSFLMTDLALSVAAGDQTWMGRRIAQSGPMLVVACEGWSGYWKRMRAASKERGWTKETFPSQFVLATGRPMLIRSDARGMTFFPDPSAILEALKQMRSRGLDPVGIIIDTVFRSFGAGNVNASPDMNIYLASVSVLTDQGYAVALVHHEIKSGGTPAGSVSLIGGSDTIVHVWRDDDGNRFWEITQAKDDQESDPHAFTLKVVPVGTDPDGQPATSCAVVGDGTAPRPQPKRGRPPSETSAAATLANLIFVELCNLLADRHGCERHSFHPESVPIPSVTRTRLRGAINSAGILDPVPDGNDRKRVTAANDRDVKRAINRLKDQGKIAADEQWIGLP